MSVYGKGRNGFLALVVCHCEADPVAMWKCAGMTAARRRVKVPASRLPLSGVQRTSALSEKNSEYLRWSWNPLDQSGKI